MDLKKITALQISLLKWYSANARDLPWRKTKDPYSIWVSEIMLQQTQVDTVIPYYEKWLKRFPTLESLAKAPLSEVMKRWAGLGYYRRARMLHEAAKKLKVPGTLRPSRYQVPSSVEELIKLPGIGRYTAGAISSIAFDQKSPIVDGNVIRILTRIFAISSDVSKPETLKKIWALAEEVLPDKKTGDFNQAMMELGATVCFPENPNCGACPVQSICKAHALKKETSFPVNRNKTKLEKIKTAALILRENGKILIQRQDKKERWGGLWMFPHWKDKKSMLTEVENWKLELKPKMKIKHGFTKYIVTLEVFESRKFLVDQPIKKNHRWIKIDALSKFAMPSPHQKIAAEILKND